MSSIRRVTGMYDLTPDMIAQWHRVERAATDLLDGYGYRELRMPILERVALFSGAMGDATDVVSKEMYAFEDRGREGEVGPFLALRPEGTAGCVRAVLQNGLLYGHATRLWYGGPMFRREKKQRGRNRQFYQIGAEVFGLAGPDVDAEQLLMLNRLWRDLGLSGLRLEINSLGTAESRVEYRQELVEFFNDHRGDLDADSLVRLEANPLRILDSKEPSMADLISSAPDILGSLDDESADHFAQVREILDSAGVGYVVNSRLVRGLDYYSRTVFEWITDELGSQGTVCAGGRYDGLVEAQGGKPTPAIGFAMGVDRLVELCNDQEISANPTEPHAYLVLAGEEARMKGLGIAEQLRDQMPQLRLESNLGGGSFKAQFKRADRSGAEVALVLGGNELEAGEIVIKALRNDQPQVAVKLDDLGARLMEFIPEFGAGAGS